MMLLAATHAIRAGDVLSRDLLTGFHPLAVALALCRPEEAQHIARAILLDVNHPMEPRYPSDDQTERQTIDAFHQVLQAAIYACVTAAGGDPARWMEPPAREDLSCQSYCPRCDRQYVITQGTCESCGGIPLVPFTAQAASAS